MKKNAKFMSNLLINIENECLRDRRNTDFWSQEKEWQRKTLGGPHENGIKPG